jgi:hypothetical protein
MEHNLQALILGLVIKLSWIGESCQPKRLSPVAQILMLLQAAKVEGN